MSVQAILDAAVGHHSAGRLHEAELLYRQVIAESPRHPVALHLLGVIAHQVGMNDAAAELIEAALAVKPDYAEAHNNLGTVLQALGRAEEAAAAYRTAVAISPGYAEAHNNLGNTLRDMGRAEAAAASYAEAVALRPDYVEAHNSLGNVHKALGRLEDAVVGYGRALALRPRSPELHNNLACALMDLKRVDEAMAGYERALGLKSDFVEAHAGLANALQALGRVDDAVASYRKALALRPDHVEALTNMGVALVTLGQVEEGAACQLQALVLRPDFAEAHTNLGLARLVQGRLCEGFREYEWRWRTARFLRTGGVPPGPAWDGGDPAGRRVLVYAEQGLGDTVMFVRYLPMLAALGCEVVLECQPSLVVMLAGVPGASAVLGHGDPRPSYDCHVALMSLPRLLGTEYDTIPAPIPYLHPDPSRVEHWRRWLEHRDGPVVGLCWRGGRAHQADHRRSMDLADTLPLFGIPGIRLVGIQMDSAKEQADTLSPTLPFVDATAAYDPAVDPFVETLAVIAAVDLVVSVDTSVAHVAGAAGRPVWLAVNAGPDWRWFLSGEASPWYPTLRLFRQSRSGDWDGVVRRMASALRA